MASKWEFLDVWLRFLTNWRCVKFFRAFRILLLQKCGELQLVQWHTQLNFELSTTFSRIGCSCWHLCGGASKKIWQKIQSGHCFFHNLNLSLKNYYVLLTLFAMSLFSAIFKYGWKIRHSVRPFYVYLPIHDSYLTNENGAFEHEIKVSKTNRSSYSSECFVIFNSLCVKLFDYSTMPVEQNIALSPNTYRDYNHRKDKWHHLGKKTQRSCLHKEIWNSATDTTKFKRRFPITFASQSLWHLVVRRKPSASQIVDLIWTKCFCSGCYDKSVIVVNTLFSITWRIGLSNFYSWRTKSWAFWGESQQRLFVLCSRNFWRTLSNRLHNRLAFTPGRF